MSDVFISYSRKDIAFARLIREALQQSQVDTWIDWERIPVGERWWNEISEAIQGANVFMFIISQNSIGSRVCKDEIDLALKNNKRIIPIIVDNLNPESIREFAPELPQFNWIIFERDHIFRVEENPEAHAEKPEDRQVALAKLPQFEEALQKLSVAIHTDWEWVKFHTRLQVDALRWENNQRNPDYLIRGAALDEAEQQLLRASGKNPQPTELQAELLTASRQEETRRQQEQLKLEQKLRQRQRLVLWAVGIGLVAAIILGVLAWSQRNEAVSQSNIRATAESNAVNESNVRATAQAVAEEQKQVAIAQRNRSIARQVAAQALDVAKQQPDLAVLLGLQSLQLDDSSTTRNGLLRSLTTYPHLNRVLINPLNGQYSYNLAFSPDGKWLVTNGENGAESIWLWNAQTFTPVRKDLYNGGCCVEGAFFSPDSTKFVVASREDVTIWDLTTFEKKTKTVKPLFESLDGTFFRFTPDGQEIVAVNKGTMYFWNPQTDQVRTLPMEGIAGTRVPVIIDPTFKIAAVEETEVSIAFYDLSTGARLKDTHTIGFGYPMVISFSADGKTLALTNTAGEMGLWDVATQTKFYERSLYSKTIIDGYSLDYAPYGSMIAIGDELGQVQLIDPSWTMEQADKKYLWKNSPLPVEMEYLREGLVLAGPSSKVTALAFSPDGRFLVSATSEGAVLVWDMQPQAYAIEQSYIHVDPLTETNSTAVFLDGATQYAAVGGCVKMGDPLCLEGGFQIWDLVSKKPLRPVQPAHAGAIGQMAFMPDGKVLATCGEDGVVKFWDVASGQPAGIEWQFSAGSLASCGTLEISPDGQYLAVAGWALPATGFLIYNFQTGQSYTINTQTKLNGILDIRFSQDSKKLYVLGPVLNKDLNNLQPPVLSVWQIPDGKLLGDFFPLNWTQNIDLTSTDDLVAAWTTDTFYAYDVAAQKMVGVPGKIQDRIINLEIQPGSRLAVVSQFFPGFFLVDLNSSQNIGPTFLRDDSRQSVRWLADRKAYFSKDGKTLISIEAEGIRLWTMDMKSWEQIACRMAGRNLTETEWKTYVTDLPYQKTCPNLP